jgi:hypothetical protein
MMYPIVESSPQAKAKIIPHKPGEPEPKPAVVGVLHHRAKYPFDHLNVGFSFTVPLAEGNETSVRMTAHGHGKKRGTKYSCIKHAEHGLLEVARIA